jgi:hypothetical protein
MQSNTENKDFAFAKLTEGIHVYQAIADVMARLSKEGIGKKRRNEQQGYSFRGIDDVYNALAPILADCGLCILPAIKSREVIERVSGNGRSLFYVTVNVDFSFVSTKDGSCHVVSMVGEAMDSGDKATTKAMSAAYKYACLQTFCIPTEGDNDADGSTHVVVIPREKPANPLDLIAPKKVEILEQPIIKEEVFKVVEVATVETTGSFDLFVPKNAVPHSTYETLESWQDAYEDLADKTAKAGKVEAKTRMNVLRELKECNEATLKRVDTVLRARHTKAYIDRIKALTELLG